MPAPALPPGHPVDTFRRENQALSGVLARMRAVHEEIAALPDDADMNDLLLRWRQCHNELTDIDKHYQRKEHALFSRLEAHGIAGPPKVMWGKDDEVRAFIKEMGEALSVDDAAVIDWKVVAATLGESVVNSVAEMIYKEENILFPMCLTAFTARDWAEVWNASPRYGWCLVEPLEGYTPEQAEVKPGLEIPASEGIALPTGTLSLEQLIAIFSALPADLTFVDADDRLAFFSEGPERVFARSRAVLGRKVQNCHPPKSVHIVERILADFRAGRQNVAEFWLDFHGRFVHVRYFAVRSREQQYIGTLEVTQDVTGIRALEGQRRLLEYGPSSDAGDIEAAAAQASGPNGHGGEMS